MKRLFAIWSEGLEKVFPDPFTLSLILTLITYLVALIWTPHGAAELVSFWGTGLWGFLPFAMQMALILVTGQALAEAPVVKRFLDKLSALPRNQTGGVLLVGVAAMVCAWLNWGFGLVVGALLARQVADSLASRLGEEHVSRGLLGAAGYSGLAYWHGGLSGSAPLAVAEEGHRFEKLCGVLPMSSMVGSTPNLLLSLLLLVAMPLFLVVLGRTGLASTGQKVPPRPPFPEVSSVGWGERLVLIPILVMALVWWVSYRGSLDLNTVIFAFLFLGLLAQGSPARYAQALDRAVSGISGIVLQFPFYAGIMGIASQSGLVGLLSIGFVSAARSTQQALGFQPFLLFVFLSAGVVNLFVPSGGGQWIIQGPIVLQAANNLGLPPEPAVMALAYGDQWTNLLQPFWALPLLSTTGLKPAQLLSVTTLLLIWEGLIIAGALCVFF